MSASQPASKFGTAFKVGALAVLAGAAVVGNFLKGAVEEAREAQVVTARTENVIRSMGLAGKVSATQIADLAGAISAKTGIDDEAIQSGQNLLLTFKNVASDAGVAGGVFEQTTGLMVDLSAAMGTDAKGAAIQLGKALNDPVKGISALTRVGVSFSEAQKTQIEGFVEGGNVAKAQAVILGELEKQFGGAAEAMATPADKARVAYDNLKEQIGTALLPILDRLLNAFVAATPAISAAVSSLGPIFAQIQGFIAPLFAQIAGFFGGGGGGGVLAGLTAFGATISATVLPVIQQFAAAFTTQIIPALTALGQAIVTNVVPVLQTMAQTFVGTILPAMASLYSYVIANLVPIFVRIVDIIRGQVIPIVAAFAAFIVGTLVPAVVKIAQAIGEKLKPIFDQLVATFKGSVLPALAAPARQVQGVPACDPAGDPGRHEDHRQGSRVRCRSPRQGAAPGDQVRRLPAVDVGPGDHREHRDHREDHRQVDRVRQGDRRPGQGRREVRQRTQGQVQRGH